MKPLAGIRVLDFGIITAGASTSAILADLGADVIKVEGPKYIDPFRNWGEGDADSDWWNASPFHHFTNRNKRSLCVDLKQAEGREITLKLARHSDIVVENFRTGVMDRLGLGLDRLMEANSRLLVGSVSSEGTTGPRAKSASFGSTLEASSGMASYIRDGDGRPQVSGQALNYPDQIASLFAAGYIVSALIQTRRTGRGMHVDLSQREIASFMIGEAIEAALEERLPEDLPVGSSVDLQGIFPAADGSYVAMTIESSVETAAHGLGLGSADTRAFARWIAARPGKEAAEGLRRAGVIAELVRRAAEMSGPDGPVAEAIAIGTDPIGRPVKGLPWLQGGELLDVHMPAPLLGQHNREVVVDLLGYSEERYRRFRERGIVATRPL